MRELLRHDGVRARQRARAREGEDVSEHEQRFWSVTSLIDIAMGKGEGLINWSVIKTAEGAYDGIKVLNAFVDSDDREGAVSWLRGLRYSKSAKAKARGSELHAAAEELALGRTPRVEPHIVPYVEQYQRFLDAFEPEFLLAEAPVYNLRRRYAGTLDGIMLLQGQSVVFDIKTTEYGPHDDKSRPPYVENALQLVAYRRAECVGLLKDQRYADYKRYYVFDDEKQYERMPETDGAVVIVISPYDFEVRSVRTDDTVWKAFLAAMRCARFRQSKDIIGPAITMPASRTKEAA